MPFSFWIFDQCTLSVYTGLPSVAGGIKQFFSLFELMCREKNLNSAPSPRQPWTLKFNTVSKKRTGHRAGSKENYNRTGLHSNRILYRREGGDWRHGENPLSAFTYYSKQKLCGIHNITILILIQIVMITTFSTVCKTLISNLLFTDVVDAV